MGASREKKERQVLKQQQAALSGKRKKLPKKKDEPTSPLVKAFSGVVIGLVSLGVLAFLLTAFRVPHRVLTAVTVGDVAISPATYSVYYYDAYFSLYSSWQSQGLDPSSEEYRELFFAYVGQQADSNIQNVALADLAHKDGMVLDEDRLETREATMKSLADAAEDAGKSLDAFLTSRYGAGVDRSVYENYLTEQLLAEQWAEYISGTYHYTQEEYDKYYEDNRDEVDSVTCRVFSIDIEQIAADTADREALQEEAKEESLAKAKEFVGLAVSESAFLEAAASFTDDEEGKERIELFPDDVTLARNRLISGWDTEEQEWLSDSGRKAGDVQYFEAEKSFTIIFFLSRQRDEQYSSIDVRHILRTGEDEHEHEEGEEHDEDEEIVLSMAEKKAEALKRGQEALDTWKAGAATEDSFAALANELTEDTGNEVAGETEEDTTYNGGLYTNVTMGSMIAPFDSWCFDSNRKPGDTGLVETVYGTHVMYFVGHAERSRWVELVHNTLLGEDVDAYLADVFEDYPVQVHDFGMIFSAAR
ncbi:MAG: peptidylprolyl isomerase [Oscillospiraceae bacterium]|nr:peptidylprolyl isomerase [Oscillospiraceae bacterium]